MPLEGKGAEGYIWLIDERVENAFYLKDFEHLVVMKVVSYEEEMPQEHWEAIVFEDETCSKIVGKQDFATEREAKECLEQVMEIALKNRRSAS